MKKLKKKLKAETKISDAHDRMDEKKDAAEKRKDSAERRKEAEQEEEGEDEESSDAEKSAVSNASSDRVAARKAEHEKMLQQRQAGKDLMKEQKADVAEEDEDDSEAAAVSFLQFKFETGDDDEKSLKAKSVGGAMKKLKKKLKAETKISDAHDRIDEMKDAK